jgi:hypothetical protein
MGIGDGGRTLNLLDAAMLLVAALAPAGDPAPLQYAQLTIREQVIIRFSGRLQPVQESSVEWKEGKKIKCIPARIVAGAAVPTEHSVDLILRNQARVRAKLDASCPALDYYYGFYITPNPDGMICADRDTIRSRMGGQCGIDRLRILKPVERD